LKQNISTPEEYPTFRNAFVMMLQKMRNVKQPLYTFVVQPILIGVIKSIIPEISNNGHRNFIVNK
jgi:hypothetical protein